jgi:hypothetical protein
MALYDRITSFGAKKLNKDTTLKCETDHDIKAYYTDEGQALKDYIIVKFKASDSSGAGTGQHQDSAYLHKIRVKVYKDGKKVYEDDITGGDGWVDSPTYWLNGEGSWSVRVKSVSSGECAKPTGTHFLGSFLAKPKEVNEEEGDTGFNDSSSSGNSVFDNTLLIGGVAVFLLLAGIKKVRKG